MYFKIAQNGLHDWWRYLLTIMIVFFAWQVVGAIPLLIAIALNAPSAEAVLNFSKSYDFTTVGINSNMGLILILVMFLFGFVGILISVKYLHKRTIISIFTGEKKFKFLKLGYAVVLGLIIMLAFDMVYRYYNPEFYERNAYLQDVIPLFIIAVFLLPFQVMFEELLFRGYLLQGFGLLFNSKWAALLVTALLFSLIHFANPEYKAYGFLLSFLYYMLAGILLGLVVIYSNGLEMAIGLHYIMNFYSIVLVTYPDAAIKSDALFRMTEQKIENATLSLLVIGVIFIFISRILFKWKPVGQLSSKIW